MMRAGRGRTVGIVDYQAGNIQSIENAFAHLGARTVRVQTEETLSSCTHLVLPGVGAFGFCAERLRASGLVASLERWAFTERRPLLGICVGMQLLADGSDESPGVPGMSWIGGSVRRLPSALGIRVPHVGWNAVEFERPYGEFVVGSTADFYFDHSYAFHQPSQGDTVGECSHGVSFCAVVRRDNIVAAQFHPEKSQSAGARFLAAFLLQ